MALIYPENLVEDHGVKMFSIAEKQQKTILDLVVTFINCNRII